MAVRVQGRSIRLPCARLIVRRVCWSPIKPLCGSVKSGLRSARSRNIKSQDRAIIQWGSSVGILTLFFYTFSRLTCYSYQDFAFVANHLCVPYTYMHIRSLNNGHGPPSSSASLPFIFTRRLGEGGGAQSDRMRDALAGRSRDTFDKIRVESKSVGFYSGGGL